MAARVKKKTVKRKAAKRAPEDPRITALGRSLHAVLARELVKGPISRSSFDSLVEYLDYLDHARYSHEEIAAMLDALVAKGLARRDADSWVFAPPAQDTCVAFLRAVNVGGKNTVPMAKVQQAIASLGLAGVKTVGHAGNILFDGKGEADASLASAIAKVLEKKLRISCDVVVRRAASLRALVDSAPFGSKEDDSVKRYVALLAKAPAALPSLPVVDAKSGLELFALRGGDALVLSRDVNGRYGFPNELVERSFGVSATTRNWSTICKLVR